MARERRSVDETLQLALDLCIGVGAFLVAGTGSVRTAVSAAMAPPDGPRRIESLARRCLTHPAARGDAIFWGAETATAAGSDGPSLTCVVAPVRVEGEPVGLLGAVHTWLPVLDDEQRRGLAALAEEVSTLLAPARPAPRHPEEGPVAESVGTLDDAPAPGAGREPGAEEREPGAEEREAGAEDAVGHGGAGPAFDAGPTANGPGGASPGGLAEVLDQLPAGLLERRPDGAWAAGVAVQHLVDSMDDGVLCLDAAGTVVLANPAALRLHGLAPGRTLVGETLPAAGGLRAEDGQPLPVGQHPGMRVLSGGSASAGGFLVLDAGGGRRHVAVSARPIELGGEDGALVVLRDVTEERREQERLAHYALHDPLTGLANRYLLLEELRRMLDGLERHGGSVTIVYLDLDRFKRVNDEHGHEFGDEVLVAVARRLSAAVRRDDVVARLGGDELVVAHAGGEHHSAEDLVSRIGAVLAAPYRVKGQLLDVGASVGWVSTETGDVGPEELLAQADRAMYRHKRDRPAVRQRAG